MRLAKKGQIDAGFIISLILFLVLTYYVIVTLSSITLPHFTQLTQREQEAEAYALSELLVSQPGRWSGGTLSGADWERHVENTTRLGLATDYHVIDMDKAMALKALSREELSALLGERFYRICIGYGDNDCGALEVNS